ncbi:MULTISPECIES: BLUF domain-containing protein [Pirellulaceae]|uniref:BLUF domain-containing protein n=1 Tax=Pirellulaceae TaxID=2691357 RepID=UPI00130484C1|nr:MULTISPECIES: BLUF domain-containing protein [Pirellulaceae]
MFALAYASYSTIDSAELDLEGLARHAASKNAALEITGYLCYDHGVFFQYLEGERQIVLDLMEVIEKDSRHDVVNTVELGEYDERIFPDWNMRYLNRSDLRRVDLENVLEHSLFHMDPKLYGQENIVALIKALVANISARQNHLKAV